VADRRIRYFEAGGGGGGGGGGTGGSTGSGSGPNTGGLPPISGETLGFPNWFPFPQQNIWNVLLPGDVGCEFGPCVPIGMGFDRTAVARVAVPFCVAQPEACALIALGGVTIYAAVTYGPGWIDTISQMARKSKEYVAHDYVIPIAQALDPDLCTGLKMLMDKTRKTNPKLFNDAKATWKQKCRGKGN
jgi:hypothetical protein